MHVVIDDGSNQIKSMANGRTRARVSRVILGALKDATGQGVSDKCWRTGKRVYTVTEVGSGALATNHDNYQTSDENRVLVNQALIDHGLSGERVQIHVTLPLDRYYQNDNVEAKRTSLLQSVENVSGLAPAIIDSVTIWPESIPAWWDYLYNEKGAEHPHRNYEKVLIGDIGGTTTDIAVLEVGEMNVPYSQSLDLGTFDITDALRARSGRRHIEQHQLEKMLRNKSEETAEAIQPVCDALVRHFHGLEPDPQVFDLILYVGGGSALMGGSLKEGYGPAEVPDEPDLAVVRGIYKHLKATGVL